MHSHYFASLASPSYFLYARPCRPPCILLSYIAEPSAGAASYCRRHYTAAFSRQSPRRNTSPRTPRACKRAAMPRDIIFDRAAFRPHTRQVSRHFSPRQCLKVRTSTITRIGERKRHFRRTPSSERLRHAATIRITSRRFQELDDYIITITPRMRVNIFIADERRQSRDKKKRQSGAHFAPHYCDDYSGRARVWPRLRHRIGGLAAKRH